MVGVTLLDDIDNIFEIHRQLKLLFCVDRKIRSAETCRNKKVAFDLHISADRCKSMVGVNLFQRSGSKQK